MIYIVVCCSAYITLCTYIIVWYCSGSGVREACEEFPGMETEWKAFCVQQADSRKA